MRHLNRLLRLATGLCLVCLVVPAASMADMIGKADRQAPTVVEVSVASSVVPLGGPWQFEPGDSPVVDGKFVWAQPDFDDSGWGKMDLHSTPDTKDPSYDNGNYVPGWSAKGYPTLTGYAWYRLRLHVLSTGQPLAIKMPDHVDDAYQVFANGALLGEFGDFSKREEMPLYRTRPLTFLLPRPDSNGNLVLAIRMFVEPLGIGYGSSPDGGGMLQTPLVGLPGAIEAVRSRERTGRMLTVIVPLFVSFMTLIATFGAGAVWLLDRQRPAYFWLTLALFFGSVPAVSLTIAFFTHALPSGPLILMMDFPDSLSLACWVFFWRRWFALPRNGWWRSLVTLLLVALSCCALWLTFLSRHATVAAVHRALFAALVGKELFVLMVLAVLIEGFRRDRTAALLAISPILLLAFSASSGELLDLLRLNTDFFPFGVEIGVGDITSVLMLLVIGVLVARRFVGTQVAERLERQSIDQDLEQASELQQKVIIPEPVVSPFFTVESEYRPARTVGGDFFQVMLGDDGSLLVVVGDVSGKGVPAAMLVAVLVGAIRTRADVSFEPAGILKVLNDRLYGRSGGHFATCLVAHILPDGTMEIANAGHIPPYSGGAGLEIAGSMPLGIVEDIEYDEERFALKPGQRLTFVTDGVLEARNGAGELLGFNRLARLTTLSASDIADTAVEFGQDDDITVVEVQFGTNTAAKGSRHRSGRPTVGGPATSEPTAGVR